MLLDMYLTYQIRRWRRVGLCGLLCLAVHGFAIAETETSTSPKKPAHASAAPAKTSKHHTSGRSTSKRMSTRTSANTSAQKSKSSRGKKGSKKRGQQAIDSARAREIQTALIREHYMQGEPSGTWDSATQAAMQRYQADQGWQSKTTPDSRALIKLGLGPSHDHLLNPESAMTAAQAAGNPKAGAKQTPADNNLPQR
jgi:Putative peptidoglycan binding domain